MDVKFYQNRYWLQVDRDAKDIIETASEILVESFRYFTCPSGGDSFEFGYCLLKDGKVDHATPNFVDAASGSLNAIFGSSGSASYFFYLPLPSGVSEVVILNERTGEEAVEKAVSWFTIAGEKVYETYKEVGVFPPTNLYNFFLQYRYLNRTISVYYK